MALSALSDELMRAEGMMMQDQNDEALELLLRLLGLVLLLQPVERCAHVPSPSAAGGSRRTHGNRNRGNAGGGIVAFIMWFANSLVLVSKTGIEIGVAYSVGSRATLIFLIQASLVGA